MVIKNEQNEVVEEIDIIVQCVGMLGRWQIATCIWLCFIKFTVAWHQLSILVIAPPMDFHCIDNTTDKCSPDCPSVEFDTSIFKETIATEWGLICGKNYLVDVAQSITMLGMLAGNMLFGFLSDRYGRKNCLLMSVILQAISGISAAYSPWFLLFLLMKFLSTTATGGALVVSFVLIVELIGVKYRAALGILYQFPFTFGHVLLPIFAYYTRHWKHIQLCISVPSAFLVIYYWVIPKSPRWLLAVGEKEAAIRTLERGAAWNKLPTEHIRGDVEKHLQKKKMLGEKVEDRGNILHLFKSSAIIRVRTLCLAYNWGVAGFCFFGVAQYISKLGGDIFINIGISALCTIPSILFSCYAITPLGRKLTTIIGDVIAGVAVLLIIVSPVNPAWIRPTLGALGLFGSLTTFMAVYIYSAELYPTVLRNISVGVCSMAARIGSMIAPFIITLEQYQWWIPPFIFGVIPLIGAGLCWWLPETANCKLPETIEEAEQLGSKDSKKIKDQTKLSENL